MARPVEEDLQDRFLQKIKQVMTSLSHSPELQDRLHLVQSEENQLLKNVGKRPLPRPVKSSFRSREEPLPQRTTVRRKVSSFEPMPQRSAGKTVSAKPDHELEKPEKAIKKLPKDLEKRISALQSTQPSDKGNYELNSLMSAAVEYELNILMDKIRQELPEASTDADKLVVDKLNADAGNDIKNVLGLNVTKRILNVTNSLYVKIEFDRKPYGPAIQNFLRWLNCTAMKRLLDGAHNYMAKIRTVADFDRAIRKKLVRIGVLKAKISPIYKFDKCPSQLKTPYKVSQPDVEIQSIRKQINNTVGNKKSESKKIETPSEINEKDVEIVAKKDVPKTENTKSEKTPAPEVTTNKVENKHVTAKKPTPTKNVSQQSNITKTAPKMEVTNETKIVTNKAATVNSTTNKAVDKTAAPQTKAITNKDAKLEAAPKKEVGKTAPLKQTPKKVAKVTTEKPKTVQAAIKPNVTKGTAGKVVHNKPDKNKQRTSSRNNDFDELNDEDILALMSNAIVLDECTGSDEEC